MRFTLLILLIGILVSACEYNFKENNFVEINKIPDDLVAPGIDLNQVSTEDTIDVFNPVELSYHVAANKLEFFRTEISLNDSIILVTTKEENSFTIDPRIYPVGMYALTVTVKTNSGNGSLMDKLHRDTIQFSKTWMLNIDGQKPEKIPIISVLNADGTLKLKWKKYSRKNFYSYRIIRNYQDNRDVELDGWQKFYEKEIDTIFDINQTEYTDSTYVGGKVYYYIVVENNTNITYTRFIRDTTAGSKYYFEDSIPRLHKTYIDSSTVRISWPKSKYYKNATGYRLNSWGVDGFVKDLGRDDTSLIVQSGIPFDNTYELFTLTNKLPKFSSIATVNSPSSEFYYFWSASVDKVRKKTYLIYNDYKILDMPEFDVSRTVSSLPYSPKGFYASPNGNYLAGTYNGELVLNYKNRDISKVPETISIISSIGVGIGSISNNGFLSYSTYSGRSFGIIDLYHNENVLQLSATDVTTAKITMDGNYLVALTGTQIVLYSFDGKQATEISKMSNTSSGYKKLYVSNISNKILYLFYYNNGESSIVKMSCDNSLQKISYFNVQIVSNIIFDRYTESVMGIDNEGILRVYDLQNTAELFHYKLNSQKMPYYSDGTLFFPSERGYPGYIYKIPAFHEN